VSSTNYSFLPATAKEIVDVQLIAQNLHAIEFTLLFKPALWRFGALMPVHNQCASPTRVLDGAKSANRTSLRGCC
jgi:hypothetical protein